MKKLWLGRSIIIAAAVMARRLTNSRFSVGRLSLYAFDAIVLTRYALTEPFIDSARVFPHAVLARPPLSLAFRHGRNVFVSLDILFSSYNEGLKKGLSPIA